VMMGQYTEPFNAAWFQKQTGLEVTCRSTFMVCPVDDWRTATLDGMVGERAIWEAKHTNPFIKKDEVLPAYLAQLHHNMDVAGVSTAHLSVFRGNTDWTAWRVSYDADYGAALHKAEWEFWMAVLADEPPVPYPPPKLPTTLAVKTADMEGDNAWADAARTWLETRAAAAKCEKAKDTMKDKIGADVKRAYGHGVEFNRDTRGALRIKAMNEED
jgi:hypothetical protein